VKSSSAGNPASRPPSLSNDTPPKTKPLHWSPRNTPLGKSWLSKGSYSLASSTMRSFEERSLGDMRMTNSAASRAIILAILPGKHSLPRDENPIRNNGADVAELVDARDLKFSALFESPQLFWKTRPPITIEIDGIKRGVAAQQLKPRLPAPTTPQRSLASAPQAQGRLCRRLVAVVPTTDFVDTSHPHSPKNQI
jgi:hypothetical protein